MADRINPIKTGRRIQPMGKKNDYVPDPILDSPIHGGITHEQRKSTPKEKKEESKESRAGQ